MRLIRLLKEVLKDGFRRWRYFSKFRNPSSPIQALAELQKDVHLIERAFSLPTTRRPFGKSVEKRIRAILARFDQALPSGAIIGAKHSLEELAYWNQTGIRPKPTSNKADHSEPGLGSRRSVRDLVESENLTNEALGEIFSQAIQAPSVSNTQPWRVRTFRSGPDQKAILALQNGNAGIDVIPVLILVTMDIRSYAGAEERNQMWIDGGIFLQQLLISIHSNRFASCPLNFSSTNAQSDRLRRLVGIAPFEEIIAFVALGAHGEVPAALSPRRSLDNFRLSA